MFEIFPKKNFLSEKNKNLKENKELDEIL